MATDFINSFVYWQPAGGYAAGYYSYKVTCYHCSFDEYLFFPDLISLNAPWGCAKTSILSYRPYSGLKYCQLMHSQLLKMLVWIMRRYVFTKRKLGLIVGIQRGAEVNFFFSSSQPIYIDIIIML